MSRQSFMGRQRVVTLTLLLLFVTSVGVLQGYSNQEPEPMPAGHFVHRQAGFFEKVPSGMSLGVETEEIATETAVSQQLTTYLQSHSIAVSPARQPQTDAAAATTCRQVLNNTALNALIEDGIAIAEPWVPLSDIVFVSSSAFTSPSHSFFLIDQDENDPTPENDAFGQGFVMPGSLTSVTVEYNTAMLEANTADEVVGALWSLKDDGTIDQVVFSWTVSDEANGQWEGRFVEITDTAVLDLMNTRGMVMGFVSFSDNANQAEAAFFDDIAVTACSNPPEGDAFLPLVMRDNRVVSGPICRPPSENPRDHWDRHRGLAETNAVCNSNLSQTDTKDYYTFSPTAVNTPHTFHLRNLPPGSEWSILVYEERGGELPVLAPGPTGGTCRIGTPGSQDKAVSCQLRANQVYIVKVSGGAYTGPLAGYQMQIAGPQGNIPTPTPTPMMQPTPTLTRPPTATPAATATPAPSGDLRVVNNAGGTIRMAVTNLGTREFGIGTSLWADIPASSYQMTITALNGPCQDGSFNDDLVIQANRVNTYTVNCNVQTITNGDFEAGESGWTSFSSNGFGLILSDFSEVGITPNSGQWAVWLGGANNETAYIEQQAFVLPSRPILSYWHFIASQEVLCFFDEAFVRINGQTIDSYGLCNGNNTNGWAQRNVDLSDYVNQTVTIQLRVETNASTNSNLFVDDVFMQPTSQNQEIGLSGYLGEMP
ncbi:MAG: hypothetical protein AAF614_25765 [Chloroflexota bacterium]